MLLHCTKLRRQLSTVRIRSSSYWLSLRLFDYNGSFNNLWFEAISMKLQFSSEFFMQLLYSRRSPHKDLIWLMDHGWWRDERTTLLSYRRPKSLFFFESGIHHVLAYSLFVWTSKCRAKKNIIVILSKPCDKIIGKCDILWIHLLIGYLLLWLEVICLPILKGLFLV